MIPLKYKVYRKENKYLIENHGYLNHSPLLLEIGATMVYLQEKFKANFEIDLSPLELTILNDAMRLTREGKNGIDTKRS